MLQDIATLTGGTVISEESVWSWKKQPWKTWVRLNVLYQQRHHHHHRWRGRRSCNPGRVAQIRQQIEEATSDYDRENCRSA